MFQSSSFFGRWCEPRGIHLRLTTYSSIDESSNTGMTLRFESIVESGGPTDPSGVMLRPKKPIQGCAHAIQAARKGLQRIIEGSIISLGILKKAVAIPKESLGIPRLYINLWFKGSTSGPFHRLHQQEQPSRIYWMYCSRITSKQRFTGCFQPKLHDSDTQRIHEELLLSPMTKTSNFVFQLQSNPHSEPKECPVFIATCGSPLCFCW